MNAFIIDAQANELLERWRIANAPAIRRCLACDVWYFSRFELVFKDDGRELHGFCEVHHSYFELKIYENGERLATLKIREPRNHSEDASMQMSPGKAFDLNDHEQYEAMTGLLRQAAFNALSINALLLCGNLIEPSDRIVGANSVGYRGGDRTFVIRPYKDTCYAVSSGAHRSPVGAFSVRGHFRRYKDGKTVWIESYFKGLDN